MSSDDENEIRSTKVDRRKAAASDMSDAEGNKRGSSVPGDESPPASEKDKEGQDVPDENDADLFGSGSEEEEAEDEPVDRRRRRRLEDEELDSGDDMDRDDRRGSPMEEDEEGESERGPMLNAMDLNLGRVAEPEPTDGQIYTLSMPNFLSIESEDFNPETYVAPPFSAASTSLCWRYDPTDGKELQSNSRIIRWSDGSLTLQLASNPTEQYRIASKPLAQPNTPSAKTGDYYNPKLDSHVYLGAVLEESSIVRLTSHLTSALTVLPTTVETDDAVQRLQESLAAATRSSNKNPDGTVAMFDVTEDPELAKKQAELAEREKLREARKRQLAADRDLDRGRRVGLSTRTGGAGLTVSGLEGEDEMSTTQARRSKKSRRRTNQRGEIFSEDEDEYDRRGRTRQDEYDEDDGFLVHSDEEEEEEGGGEEEDEEEILADDDMDAEGESDHDVAPRKPAAPRDRERTSPKRALEDTTDKPTEPNAAATSASPPTRKKHRYVIDEDEDE